MSTNLAEVLVDEIDDILLPLTRVTTADDPLLALRRFLLTAGWRMSALIDPAPVVAAIEGVGDAVESTRDGLETDDLASFAGAVNDVTALMGQVEALIEQIAQTGPGTASGADLAAFGEDVLHELLGAWLRRKAAAGDLAWLTGVVGQADVDARSLAGWLERDAGPRTRVTPDALLAFLDDPFHLFRPLLVDLQQADAVALNLLLHQFLNPLLEKIGGRYQLHPDALAGGALTLEFGRQAIVDVTVPIADDRGRANFGTELEVLSVSNDGPGVELAPYGEYAHGFDLGAWRLTLAAAVLVAGDAEVDRPPIRLDRNGLDVDADVDASIEAAVTFDLDMIVGGQGTRFELGTLRAGFSAGVTGGEHDAGFELVAEGSKIVLSAADLGDALAAVADFDTTVEFALGIGWSRLQGLHLAGSASLELEVAEDIDLGGIVAIAGLRLRLELTDAIVLTAVTDASINLGPVVLAFEELGLGIRIGLSPGADPPFALAVEPPKSIGVRVDAGVVVGGGYLFLDPDNGEYAGVLELSFPALSLSLKAVGVFTTQLPGGAEGYALLLLVYTEFPAVQLGYGFTLNGVGGILGLQHRVSTDALAAGLRTGALDRVLFPDDPVGQAPQLLADLRAIFPITPGALTFGPALLIGWGQGILTLSLGVVVQFDDVIGAGGGDPTIARIVLLGQLEVQLPPDEDVPELVRLLVDVVGWFEVDELELGIDARLRDSHVAGLPLTGSMVVRARFGDDPTFILAVGGFHPRFTDLPPGLPEQDRVGFELVYGILRVGIAGYVAVTSNTFQVGAQASLYASVAGFTVDATLGFDALFFFEPRFHFVIDFEVGAAISWKRWDLTSIRFTGTVTGPGRWEIAGYATFSVAWWDKEVDVNESWGAAPATPLPTIDVLPKIRAALAAPDAWHVSLPGGRPHVTLRQPGDDAVVAHPLGQLHVRQKVVPFGVTVDRVGQARPADADHFTLDAVTVGAVRFEGDDIAVSREHFARGEYLDLSEDQKLATPSFERFEAGASVGTDAYTVPGGEVAFEPEFETTYLEAPEVHEIDHLDGLLLFELTKAGAVARSSGRRDDRYAGARLDLTLAEPGHLVADADTLAVDADLSLTAGDRPLTFTEASQAAVGADAPRITVEAAEVRV